jgi:oligosaccharide repeat unit polymerase
MPDHFYYTLILVAFTFIPLSWLKSGRLFNPVTIFCAWWCFFIFVSSLHIVNMNAPTPRVYYHLLLAVVMFCTGGITFLSPASAELKRSEPGNFYIKPVKLRLFLFFQLLITLLLFVYLNKAINMLKSMDPGSFRGLVFDEGGVLGANRKYFMYIILPSLYINAFISVAGVLYGRLRMPYMVIALFNLILYSAVTIGRSPIFIALMGFGFGVIYLSQIKKIKIKPLYVILVSLPVIYMVSISIFRKSYSSGSTSALTIFANYFVWYFTGPFTAFDHFLDFMKEGRDYDFSYFRAMVGGIEDFVYPLLKRIFPGFTPINEYVHGYTKIFRPLGGFVSHHNSHYTMVMEFMWDAGYFGIIIYPYIFGSVIAKVYNSFRKNHSIASFGILLILTYLSIMGVMRWELRYIWSWATIAGIIFFSQKFYVMKTSGNGIR